MEPLLSPSIPQSQNPEPSLQCPNFKVDEEEDIKPEIKRETPENLTSSSIKSEPTIIKVEANCQLPPQGEMIKQVFVGGKTMFRCAICSYRSKWKPPVEQHLVVHSDQKPYACPIDSCKYRSKWPECVKHHGRVVHRFDLTRKVKLEVNNENSSLCSIKENLRSNTNYPEETQPYPDIEQAGEQRALFRCDKCSYETSSAHNMKMHIRIHSAEKPFKCVNGGCDYSARWAHNLRVHQRSCRQKKLKRLEQILPKIQKKPTQIRVKQTKKIQVNIEAAAAAKNYSDKQVELETAPAFPSIPQSPNPEPALQCPNFKVDEEEKLNPEEIKRETPELTSWNIKIEPSIIEVETPIPESALTETGFQCAGCSKSFTRKSFLLQHQRMLCRYRTRRPITRQPAIALQENTTLAPEITDNVAQRSAGVPKDNIVQANGQLPTGEMIKQVFVGGKTLLRCAICGYKSKWKSVLEQHLVVHSDQKPFACPIGRCNYQSKWSRAVRSHARKVHQFYLPKYMKLFQETSSFKAKIRSNVRKQPMVYVATVPLRCPREGCKYQTRWSSALKGHARLVHGHKAPRQNGCKYQTKCSSELRKQARVVHHNQSTPKAPPQTQENSGSDRKCKDKIEGFVRSRHYIAFACMFCEFIGYSELSALKHSCQHKTVVISFP